MKIFTNPKNIVAILLILQSFSFKAQGPCNPGVPAFTINLTGFPAGVWTSPSIPRNGLCCGVSAPNECIYFYLTLDPNAAGIQIDMMGADPAGSLFYNISCQGSYPGGTIKCISGVGPHEITFCKPGGNSNVYKITSIAKPLFPKDDSVRIGCKHKFISYGVQNNSVTWTSIYPGSLGQYNNYLDSTNVASPTYSPGPNAPAYIDYKVCGMPIASICGYSVAVCDTVRIYNFQKLTATVTPNPAYFCNLGPGSGVNVFASASGGSPAYSYTWKNTNSITVGTGSNYFATAAGNYSVEVKDVLFDVNECPALYTVVTVSQGTMATVDAGPSQKKCASNPLANLNGSVQFASGGIWSGGNGNFSPGNNFLNASYYPTQSELNAGSVKLYLTTVGAGCGNKTDSMMVYYSGPVNVSIPSASIACNGGTTTLYSNVAGGTSPLSYSWSNGSQVATTAAGQGVYSLYVTDSLGCSGSAGYTLSAPASLSLTYNLQNVLCFNGNTGSVSLNVSGGTAPYSYLWSNGGVTQNISGLTAGNYSVTVQDANSCSANATMIISQPAALVASASVTSNYNGQNISCYGYSNGSASATANGGTQPYSYSWTVVPAQNNAIAQNLAAGTYSVYISDANGCQVLTNVTLNQPQVVGVSLSVTSNYNGQNISCNGSADGSALATASGGVGGFTYQWNTVPSQTTAAAINLSAGNYSVTVTDINGCSTGSTIGLTQPPAVVANAIATSNYNGPNISCFGLSDGAATATAAGGTSPYTFTWSTNPVQNGPSASNLPAGNYTVSISDANGCQVAATLSLTQNPAIGILLTNISNFNGFNVSCFGSSNGYIDVSTTGGTGGYTFNWSNGAITDDIFSLAAGSYSLLVSDANGCQAIFSANIVQPPKLVLTIDSLSNYNGYNMRCSNSADANAYASVGGGVPGYAYQWNNGNNNLNLLSVGQGVYVLTVTDQNMCIAVNEVTLIAPPPIQIAGSTTKPLCHGDLNGSVNISTSGGVNPFSFQWSNGSQSQNLNPIGAGTYTVVYSDKNGCAGNASFIIDEPPAISITKTVSPVKCYGDSAANIFLNFSGGSMPYYCLWSNGSKIKDQLNLKTGLYVIKVQDSNGCISTDSTLLAQPDSLSLSLSSPLQFNNHHITYPNGDDGTINSTVNGGVSPYNYIWSNQATQSNIYNVQAGSYTLAVTDAKGCKCTASITLTEPEILEMPQAISPNSDGKNDFFVVHGIEAFPANHLTIYNRWGNIVFDKTGYQNEWQGEGVHGKTLPDATYFAVLVINNGEKVLKGFVELRR